MTRRDLIRTGSSQRPALVFIQQSYPDNSKSLPLETSQRTLGEKREERWISQCSDVFFTIVHLVTSCNPRILNWIPYKPCEPGSRPQSQINRLSIVQCFPSPPPLQILKKGEMTIKIKPFAIGQSVFRALCLLDLKQMKSEHSSVGLPTAMCWGAAPCLWYWNWFHI